MSVVLDMNDLQGLKWLSEKETFNSVHSFM